jgi:poly-beta-1,6-N-acetyl-D-glucosamine synthase
VALSALRDAVPPAHGSRSSSRTTDSTDDTALLADEAGERLGLDYRRVFETKQGKHHALNTALATVTTPLVVTVDADTHLQEQSLTRLVVRVTNSAQGQHVSACAAALVAENPMATFVTRMQQWDLGGGTTRLRSVPGRVEARLVPSAHPLPPPRDALGSRGLLSG